MGELAPSVRKPLFRKYVGLFVAVVSFALLANGGSELWFSFQEHRASLIRIQREQATAAAAEIKHFIKEIENQLGWTTQLSCRPAQSNSAAWMDCASSVRFRPSPSYPWSTRPARSSCGSRA